MRGWGLRMNERKDRPSLTALCGSSAIALFLLAFSGAASRAGEDAAGARFREVIEPLLTESCYGCHGNGAKKGNVAFDGYMSEEDLRHDRKLWSNVLKNVRAGVMPPADKARPTAEQIQALAGWIKQDVFGIDPNDPDPGRVTIRRLNRVEYRNTIRDLTGFDFRADEEFPPDDTGYGFDTIGDVLTVSPLLLEKYLDAAETIVAGAVPLEARIVHTETITGKQFRAEGANGDRMTFYKPAKVSHVAKVDQEGSYRLRVNLEVRGGFDFDPGRCEVIFRADDHELVKQEFAWQDGKKFRFEFPMMWQAGDHPLELTLEPKTPPEQKKSSVDLRILSVVVEGPLEPERWVRPKNFDMFFSEDDPGKTAESQREYARATLSRFATRAYRRPVEEATLKRLVTIAEDVYRQPGKTVQEGIARAIVGILASPRFLFRVEETEPAQPKAHPLLDEYALASRLSYFLWSTLPDDELFQLAARKALRNNLEAQVKRMLGSPKSNMLIENFTGQWLQARDVEGIAIDARTVLARDDGKEKELKREMEEFRAFLEARAKQSPQAKASAPPRRPRLFSKPRAELDGPLRAAMKHETEMFFGYVAREDRSVLDLIDSDYTFVNAPLAKHYGIPDVKGDEMRRVTLPEGSPRGGLLTMGTVLVVTSNPTRTSPVKRGLFLLDNIMGTPPPPPPADVPQLEDAEKTFSDKEPTLREILQVHRSKPLCNSCHSRMDPLGLALENFNAMGMWRDQERNQELDTAGTLITGEPFKSVRDLKRILRNERRADFYRCLTEKLFTYALGRGLEDTDVDAVDRVVERLEREEGRFSALLMGIIESAPFQKRRSVSVVAAAPPQGRPGPTESASPMP